MPEGTVFLFPGQGSQYVGMGEDLFTRFPEARACFERANEVLEFDLTDTMFGKGRTPEDAGEALKQTNITQPALYVHSLAAMAILKKRGAAPHMAAGHSLGEYSALAATSAIDFEDGLRIVRLRGGLMAEAGERRPGTMAAVLGMDDDVVAALCLEATQAPDSIVEAANYNAPGQVVISGDAAAVERAMVLARERGAKRVVPLPVSGAFHSALMEYARDGLAEALLALRIRRPSYPVYLNVTAEPSSDPEEIRRRLLEQLTAPVRWSQILKRMHEEGARRFIEIGAGNVLSGLVRRTLGRDVETMSIGKAEDLETAEGIAYDV